MNFQCWLVRRLISVDDSQRLYAGVENLHSANDDAPKWVVAFRTESSGASGFLCHRRELVEVQIVACQRADKIRAARFDNGMERVGVRHLLFEEMLVVFAHSDI